MKLFRKYFSWVDSFLTKEIDATGLALFRITYCAILSMEILQIIYFRHLIYDKIPFLNPAEINVLPGLLVWLGSVIFILFGFYTRKAALVNYVLSLVFIGTIKTYEYHVFYTYMGTNFLFLFLDISKVNSIDRLRAKLKYSSAGRSYTPSTKVGVWHYFLPVAVGLGFVYFDSIFFKLSSYNWINGLGMWLPASLPMATHLDVTPFLNMKWLSIGLGYLTVVFELVFLFTFFLKKFRIPLLIVGAGLHLGITLIFPIPWFGMTALAVYLLMVPIAFWRYLYQIVGSREPSLTVYFDEQCPLCNRTRITFQHFDFKNKIDWQGLSQATSDSRMDGVSNSALLTTMHSVNSKGKIFTGVNTYLQIAKRIPLLLPFSLMLSIPGIKHLAQFVYGKVATNRTNTQCTDDNCGYVPPVIPAADNEVKILQNLNLKQIKVFGWGMLLLFLIFLQVNVTFHSKLVQENLDKIGVTNTKLYNGFLSYSKKIWGGGKVLFGITRHGVFMDQHFEDYNHIVAIEAEMPDGSKKWLPIINEDGTAGWYDYSFLWVKWTFRVMDNHVNQTNLVNGIRDFGTFWIIKNGYDPQDVKFNIYVKSIKYPKEWEKDFLRNQKMRPWQKVGVAYWEGEQFLSTCSNIETIGFNE